MRKDHQSIFSPNECNRDFSPPRLGVEVVSPWMNPGVRSRRMELRDAVLAELQTQRRPMRVAELAERFDRLHAEIMIALEKLAQQGFVEMRSDGSWAVRCFAN